MIEDENENLDSALNETEFVLEEKAQPVEFVPAKTFSATAPTFEQKVWLAKNKDHQIMSHHRSVRFSNRGTLKPDGSFVPESAHPVMDGAGQFGVGVPLAETRRRR